MRQIMTLCMAHYQWVYGKITEPSDKLVIDSESETYAPSRDWCRRLEIPFFFKMAHSEK